MFTLPDLCYQEAFISPDCPKPPGLGLAPQASSCSALDMNRTQISGHEHEILSQLALAVASARQG